LFPNSIRFAVVGVCVVLAASCADGSDGTPGTDPVAQRRPIQELAVTVAKSGAQLSVDSIKAAPVTVSVTNNTKGPYHIAFARLNEGVSLDEVEKNIQSDKVLELITVAGSTVDAAKPGGTTEVTIQFPEGDYIALDPEAKIPFAPFSVTAASGEYEMPESEYEVEAGDFYFEMPKTIAAGPVTLAVTNAGEQSHEMSLGFVKGGSEEGEAFMLVPAPGGTAWAEFNLEPRKYQALCYFPDPKTGKPHIKLGMRATFTVK